MSLSRRSLVRGAAALTAAGLPASIRRALAAPALGDSHSIMDIEHIVILMQENRSFDHYFGTLPGVRGYGDRIIPKLSGSTSVWTQKSKNGEVILPFPLNGQTTDAQHVTSLPHGWPDQHAAWNHGRMDNWVPAKGEMTMSYFPAQELPFHTALANAFTICDAYYSSIPGSTCPNRAHLMTGTIDPSGQHGGPMIMQPEVDKNFMPIGGPTYSWTTFPERLEEANISWRIYQGQDQDGSFEVVPQDEIRWAEALGRDEPDGIVSCYNILYFFKQYASARPDSPLYKKALTRRTPKDFAEDVKSGTLPQVSWLMPPYEHSEHPRRSPANGAAYISTILDALTANPEVWGKTALFIVYDENDGYFDHITPPTPPANKAEGLSNIAVADDIHVDGLPIGLGFRVPAFVISPWSKGGAVCSQVFDHTSVIRFIETRFGVHEPNISAWRRKICGDLTSAFDFKNANKKTITLPDTRHYMAYSKAQEALPPPRRPDLNVMPTQAKDPRTSLPLPYNILAYMKAHQKCAKLKLVNASHVGVVLHTYEQEKSPKRYSIARKTTISDIVYPDDAGFYNLQIIGPNGFMRNFLGNNVFFISEFEYNDKSRQFRFMLHNNTSQASHYEVIDNAYGSETRKLTLLSGKKTIVSYDASINHGWYDLTVNHENNSIRFAGRLENGQLSLSDPA